MLHTSAPAKVNLCLFLGPTRADGRHELVTLFQALDLSDELTMRALDRRGPDRVSCPGIDGENLAHSALAMLRERGWAAPPVEVTIEKRIPIAGGMAGGSADAAAVLRLAAELHPFDAADLQAIAVQLGADVPSQIAPGLALGTGAGERLTPVAPLAEHAFVVVPSTHQLATADVFREADRQGLPRSSSDLSARHQLLQEALRPGARLPADLATNDLQPAALALCPPIAEALDALVSAGADQAIVSGSGPTAVGIWWGPRAPVEAEAAAAELRTQFPAAVAARSVNASHASVTMPG